MGREGEVCEGRGRGVDGGEVCGSEEGVCGRDEGVWMEGRCVDGGEVCGREGRCVKEGEVWEG